MPPDGNAPQALLQMDMTEGCAMLDSVSLCRIKDLTDIAMVPSAMGQIRVLRFACMHKQGRKAGDWVRLVLLSRGGCPGIGHGRWGIHVAPFPPLCLLPAAWRLKYGQ